MEGDRGEGEIPAWCYNPVQTFFRLAYAYEVFVELF